MAQMKEQIKTPKTELSDEEIPTYQTQSSKYCTQDVHRNDLVWLQNGERSEGYAK